MYLKSIILSLSLLISGFSLSQNLIIGIAYQYQHAPEWEQMVRNYNDSSTWQEKNQPYLNGGLNANLQVVLAQNKLFQFGITSTYIYSRSYANNYDSTVAINQNGLNLGVLVKLDNEEKLKNFFFELGFSFAMNFLARKTKYTSNLIDLQKVNTFGYGGNLDFKFGYKVRMGDFSFMTPFLGFAYTYLFDKKAYTIFQPFQSNDFKTLTGIICFKVGVQFEFNLNRKK